MVRSWNAQHRSAAVVRALAWLAALGALAVGVLALGGTAWGVTAMSSVVAGLPMTTPQTCIALVLGGVALGLRLPARRSPLREALAVACATGMALIGGVNLAQDMGALALDSNALLPGALRGAPRPATLTACCLVLLGGALGLLGGSVRWRPSTDSLTLLTLLGALLGLNLLLLGPLVSAQALASQAQRGMGLLTALALLLLCMGTYCARPDQGLMTRLTRDTLGAFLARRLVPVALLGPVLLGMGLVVLHGAGLLMHEATFPIFATLVSAGGVGLVLLAARALDLLEAGRRQATLALEASEARFRGLLETMPAPLVTVDALGLLRFVNAEAERVFGYTREELLGREVEVLLPEGLFGGRRLDSNPTERVLSGVRKDGTGVPLEVRLRPVHDSSGQSLLAILRDVTEREQFFARVQRAREDAEVQRGLLQAVLDHAPVGIVFVDPERDSMVANRVAEGMLEREDKATGRASYLHLLRHPDGRPVSMEELPSSRAAALGRVVGPEEFHILQKDGGTLPVLATAAPVRGPSGEPRGVVVSLQDLTTRRELERLREEYVSLISHDLRNPLHTINLRAHLLQRGLHERHLEREEGLTESILHSVAWMSSMIEELLEGSRLEAGRETLRREPRELVRFLEEVLERDVPLDLRERFRLEVAGVLPPGWLDA
ncbi:MAG TPA: PAS domain S-box protein, partial [Myxococcus sp.]|nr:PAS domain S-box protein [Myxococcus sp.]